MPPPPLTCPSAALVADSTGTHSLYTTYQDYEIMFHVSTMLPYTPNNRQQVTPSHPQQHPWLGFPLLSIRMDLHLSFGLLSSSC